jgi:hypothetical protein
MDTRWLDAETDRELRLIAQRSVAMAQLQRGELARAYDVRDPDALDPSTGDAAMPHRRGARELLIASVYAARRTAEKPHLEGDLISGVRREEFSWELDKAREHMRDVGVPSRLWSPTPDVLEPQHSERSEREGSRPLPQDAAWSLPELQRGHAMLRDSIGVMPYEMREHGQRGAVAALVHVRLPAYLELAGAKVDVEPDSVRREIEGAKRAMIEGRRDGNPNVAIAQARQLGEWIRPHLKFGAGDYLGLGGGTMAGPGMVESTVRLGREGAMAEALREGVQVDRSTSRGAVSAMRTVDGGRTLSR